MNEEKINLILEKIEELENKVEDNNKILHAQRNSERLTKFLWFIKWILIVSFGILAWSYLQPIYNSVLKTYDNIASQSKELNESTKDLRKNLKNLNNLDARKLIEKLKSD